jgi:hypothetical protein
MENLYNALYLLSPIDGVSSSEKLTTGEFLDYNFTLDALALNDSDFCNTGDNYL